MKEQLICPVKRLEEPKSKPSNVGIKIDLLEGDMDINLNINAKSIIKSVIGFISNKFKEKV